MKAAAEKYQEQLEQIKNLGNNANAAGVVPPIIAAAQQ